MSLENVLAIALIVLAVVVVGFWVATHYFSDAARWERRRRRSNAPITSKGDHRPSVKLSVKTKKKKGK